tara:strand:+ start:4017 stop:4916 length:900 start_codon:yes stop_codon:yes gene_type:complete
MAHFVHGAQDLKGNMKMNQRLERLEKELLSLRKSTRRWRVASCTLLLGVGLLAADVIGPTVIDHLIVNRIDVVGDKGTPVVSIAKTDDGGRLDLYNQSGINLLRVSSTPSGGDVAIWDEKGTNVAGLWSAENGGTFSLWNAAGEELSQFASGALTLSGPSASLHIQNKQGDPIAVVASDPQGHGRFQIADASGNVVSEMLMLPEVGGALVVNSNAGKKMAILAATDEGGRLNLMNARSVPVFIASPTGDSGGGAMTITNQRGVPVVIMKSDEEHRGIIEILDADGNGVRRIRPLRGYSP